MLRAQIRAADDERQQISAELHERITKIDKLRKRYEILMVAMAPPEGEEEKSQAYYVIKVCTHNLIMSLKYALIFWLK